MNITIGKPSAVCEKGGRMNNEDSIYPMPEAIRSDQKLFLVCDGVGGAEKGEIASALAAESFQTYFSTFLENEPTAGFIRKAIQYTETRFDDYVAAHPEAAGMATTLTMVYIGDKGITVAHVGDSRVYQFRGSGIRFRTDDHSLVNSLLKLGQIKPEEVRRHPQRNVILRAIQGSRCPTEADVVLLDDIQPGDCLFMCTDGVLERFTDEELSAVFARTSVADTLKDILSEECRGRTRDNFSFYILPVQNVHESPGIKQNILSFLYSFI